MAFWVSDGRGFPPVRCHLPELVVGLHLELGLRRGAVHAAVLRRHPVSERSPLCAVARVECVPTR